MSDISGVLRLGRESEGPVDIAFRDGVIADIRPSAASGPRRLALPALANAHDHCRPLSPTSFGGAGKPLELWLLRLAAMPAVDPYLGALAAFGRAARGGAGSVMAHYTRFHTADPVAEAREVARAARDVGVRVDARGVHARPQPHRLRAVGAPARQAAAGVARGADAELRRADAEPGGADRARRGDRRRGREPGVFRAVRAQRRAMVLGRAVGRHRGGFGSRSGRRVHMHFLETRYQRAFADANYPEGVAARLERLGLLSPRLTLAHCVYAREEELDALARCGVTLATNPSSNLHLRSGIAPVGEAIRRGVKVALGVDASALDEDDDILRELRLGHFLHAGWGFEETVSREDWLAAVVANGRRANGAPGSGRLEVGEPADILVLDLDRLDRDAVTPVAPVDLLFARATAAHIEALLCRGAARGRRRPLDGRRP